MQHFNYHLNQRAQLQTGDEGSSPFNCQTDLIVFLTLFINTTAYLQLGQVRAFISFY